jgi:hypothetical protein
MGKRYHTIASDITRPIRPMYSSSWSRLDWGGRETENDEHEEHKGDGDGRDRGTLPQTHISVLPPSTHGRGAELTNAPSDSGPGLKSFSNTNLDTMGVLYSTYVAVTEIVNTAPIAARFNSANNPIRGASTQSNHIVLTGVLVSCSLGRAIWRGRTRRIGGRSQGRGRSPSCI